MSNDKTMTMFIMTQLIYSLFKKDLNGSGKGIRNNYSTVLCPPNQVLLTEKRETYSPQIWSPCRSSITSSLAQLLKIMIIRPRQVPIGTSLQKKVHSALLRLSTNLILDISADKLIARQRSTYEEFVDIPNRKIAFLTTDN